MNEEKQKIKSFKDLNVWKEGHKLVILIYEATENFPQSEVFALTNQMRRCSVSITSNIAEGFGRQSYKEKIQFYSIAQGSLAELQNQLLVSKDVHFLSGDDFIKLDNQSVLVQKILSGLIKKTKSFI